MNAVLKQREQELRRLLVEMIEMIDRGEFEDSFMDYQLGRVNGLRRSREIIMESVRLRGDEYGKIRRGGGMTGCGSGIT